jgi:hypothetical protein
MAHDVTRNAPLSQTTERWDKEAVLTARVIVLSCFLLYGVWIVVD